MRWEGDNCCWIWPDKRVGFCLFYGRVAGSLVVVWRGSGAQRGSDGVWLVGATGNNQTENKKRGLWNLDGGLIGIWRSSGDLPEK